MNAAVFCSNMRLELGFKEGFGSVRLYIGNILSYFFVQELMENGKIPIHFVKPQDQITDLGTKHVNKHRRRALIKLFREFEA